MNMKRYVKDGNKWYADVYTDNLRWDRRRVYVEDNELYVLKDGKYCSLSLLQAQGISSAIYFE